MNSTIAVVDSHIPPPPLFWYFISSVFSEIILFIMVKIFLKLDNPIILILLMIPVIFTYIVTGKLLFQLIHDPNLVYLSHKSWYMAGVIITFILNLMISVFLIIRIDYEYKRRQLLIGSRRIGSEFQLISNKFNISNIRYSQEERKQFKAIYDYVKVKLEHSSPSVKQKWERKLKQYNLDDPVDMSFFLENQEGKLATHFFREVVVKKNGQPDTVRYCGDGQAKHFQKLRKENEFPYFSTHGKTNTTPGQQYSVQKIQPDQLDRIFQFIKEFWKSQQQQQQQQEQTLPLLGSSR
jgi:hypothetical protein